MPDDRSFLQWPATSDAYSPSQIAARVEASGVAKAEAPLLTTVTLGVLAGVFIAFGAMLYTVVMTGVGAGFGPARLLGGMAFSLRLVLRRRRIVHRQQPDRHGVGRPTDYDPPGAAQLDGRLCR